MSSYYAQRFATGAPWSATGVGTSAGVTVSKAAVTGSQHWVSSISCSGDAACLVTIESPDGTVLWRKRFAAAFNTDKDFDPPLQGADSQLVEVKISASTTNCEANISGFTSANI